MTGRDLQSRLVRRLEVRYHELAAFHRQAGLSADEAHERALEESKAVLRDAIEELRRRGLFPWPESGAVEISTAGDAGSTGRAT